MFNKPDSNETGLEEVIDRLIEDVKNHDSDTEEYADAVTKLDKLWALKSKKPEPLNMNTIATVAANLAGILLIVQYERERVVTSKALGLVLKLR